MKAVNQEMRSIFQQAAPDGWVIEPEAKRFFALAGLSVPRFAFVRTPDEAVSFAKKIGYPVVAKIVSPQVVHKADVGGVAVGIENDQRLAEVCRGFQKIKGFRGILVEEMVKGVELILGAKKDPHFGPVVLLGMGGTGVEIYRDAVMRMAPLSEDDASIMYRSLRGHQFLEGYRGSAPVALDKLVQTVTVFSRVVMEMEDMFGSIDINPLMCSPKDCIVADARIILPG